MKRRTKLALAGGVAVVVLAVPLSNLVLGGPSNTALTKHKTDDARLAEVAKILENKCGYCHVPDSGKPFYASFPGVSSTIDADVAAGLRDLDLVAELFPPDGVVSEPTLARLQRVAEREDMPPRRYRLLHWNGLLGYSERGKVLDWVREVRSQKHADQDQRAQVRILVVRPLSPPPSVDPHKVALGEKLYNDKRLSGDGTVSCASCHDLGKGGTDQTKVSIGIGGKKGGINAPTTFNSHLQFRQFWDGRAATLEEQAAGPPANPVEMGATWDGIVATLQADPAVVAEFKVVYADGVTKATVTDAIAEFERTLVTPSRFDKYLLGDETALAPEEKKGFELFKEKGCATCHVGELLGGRSFEVLGRRQDYFRERGNPTDADNGRFNVTRTEHDRHRFKVPTLRNVARTFPYFHDGSQATLAEAVSTMGRVQLGAKLTNTETASIVTFLGALTGQYKGKAI